MGLLADMRTEDRHSIIALSILFSQLALGTIIIAQRQPPYLTVEQAVQNERLQIQSDSLGHRLDKIEGQELDKRVGLIEAGNWRSEKLLYGIVVTLLGNMGISAAQLRTKRRDRMVPRDVEKLFE